MLLSSPKIGYKTKDNLPKTWSETEPPLHGVLLSIDSVTFLKCMKRCLMMENSMSRQVQSTSMLNNCGEITTGHRH